MNDKKDGDPVYERPKCGFNTAGPFNSFNVAKLSALGHSRLINQRQGPTMPAVSPIADKREYGRIVRYV
jgi:hypothetical protein